jgi:hypothetical protein
MARPGPVGGQYQPLTEDQIKQVHQASLTVLERIGIHVENEEALALYRQGGARVDGNRVYITPAMVAEALEKVPSKVLLAGRDPDQDVVLEEPPPWASDSTPESRRSSKSTSLSLWMRTRSKKCRKSWLKQSGRLVHETCTTHGGTKKSFEHCTEVWYNIMKFVSDSSAGYSLPRRMIGKLNSPDVEKSLGKQNPESRELVERKEAAQKT